MVWRLVWYGWRPSKTERTKPTANHTVKSCNSNWTTFFMWNAFFLGKMLSSFPTNYFTVPKHHPLFIPTLVLCQGRPPTACQMSRPLGVDASVQKARLLHSRFENLERTHECFVTIIQLLCSLSTNLSFNNHSIFSRLNLQVDSGGSLEYFNFWSKQPWSMTWLKPQHQGDRHFCILKWQRK